MYLVCLRLILQSQAHSWCQSLLITPPYHPLMVLSVYNMVGNDAGKPARFLTGRHGGYHSRWPQSCMLSTYVSLNAYTSKSCGFRVLSDSVLYIFLMKEKSVYLSKTRTVARWLCLNSFLPPFAVLGIESRSRTSHILSKRSTPEPHPRQPCSTTSSLNVCRNI